MADNLDLQARRRRLRLTQWDIAQELGLSRAAYISEFETGNPRNSFPNGLGRADYEKLLDRLEAQRQTAA